MSRDCPLIYFGGVWAIQRTNVGHKFDLSIYTKAKAGFGEELDIKANCGQNMDKGILWSYDGHMKDIYWTWTKVGQTLGDQH